MPMHSSAPVGLFISYSHQDESLKDQLVKHLAGLRRSGFVSEWHDRKLVPGQEWDRVIRNELETAQIILLLISSDFLSSDYCNDIEIREAMRRHDEGRAVVIPVILRPCDWKTMPFGRLQALPTDAKPITKWQNTDDGFLDVIENIRDVIRSMGTRPKTGNQDAGVEKIEPGFFTRFFGDVSAPGLRKHRWILSFTILLASVTIAVVVYRQGQHDRSQPATSSTDSLPSSLSTSPAEALTRKVKTYCRVTLLIPSDLSDAEVFVDGHAADVIERKPTALTVKMEKRTTGQRIVLRNSVRKCSSHVIVDGEKQVIPCQ